MGLVDIQIISPDTAGDVRKNDVLMDNLSKATLDEKLFDSAMKGTPLLTIGEDSPKIMLTAGVHGNELSPQIAILMVARNLMEKKFKGSVFIIPFAIPFATMEGNRRFKGFDMNRSTSKDGSLTNKILKFARDLKLDSLADFHSTKPYSNPGVESVFCSKKPCPLSYKIAKHINRVTESKIICHKNAGTLYHGALEDECNLADIPAVTCEVVSYNNKVDPGSHERSYLQMSAYLDYFGIKLDKMYSY